MSVRSPWEWVQEVKVSNAHFIKSGESCVPGRVSEGVTHSLQLLAGYIGVFTCPLKAWHVW